MEMQKLIEDGGSRYENIDGPRPRKGDTWMFTKSTIRKWINRKGPLYKQNAKLFLKWGTWRGLYRTLLRRIIIRLIGVHDDLIDLPYDLKQAKRIWDTLKNRHNSDPHKSKPVYQYTPEELLSLPKLNKAYADATMEFKSFPPFTDLKDGSIGVDAETGQVVKWTPPPALVKRGRKKKK